MMNLKEFIENNPKLVTHKESTRYPGLFVIKYTRKVFYDYLWTPELEECRGLVVDKNWNKVIVPFRKIYNLGENNTNINPDTRVTAVRKINGFMAAATYVDGYGVIVSTTGSLDSPFVELAEKHLRPVITDWIHDLGRYFTWLFEICDESDPHIIKEEPGIYLIGVRSHYDLSMVSEANLDVYASHMKVLRPHYYNNIRFETILNLVKDAHHEGFVVHGPDKTLKIKTPYYLITKFLGRMRSDKFLDCIMTEEFYKTIDEEYYPLLNYLKDNKNLFTTFDEQGKICFIRNFLSGDKIL